MKTAIFDQADYFKNLAKANREIDPESNIQVDLYFQAKLENVTTAELLSGAVLTLHNKSGVREKITKWQFFRWSVDFYRGYCWSKASC
jgi:hypothetical protein